MYLAPRGGQMPKTVTSPLQKKLATMLVEQRKKAGLRQVDLAKKMGVYQSWVTHMESGQRRIDVIELIELGKAIGFDAADMVRKLSRR
jgi:ribosome-binding protein aMBF1 (putative translation factor)